MHPGFNEIVVCTAPRTRSGVHPEGILDLVRGGLPFAALENLVQAVGASQGEIASVVGMPNTTLVRRRRSGRLTPAESDRVVRVARLAALARELVAWRLAAPAFAQSVEDMLSGEAARRYGGRWNSPGRPAVYLGDSLALAAMELLVHLESADVLGAYRKMPVYLPERLVMHIEAAELPTGWETASRTTTRAIGDRWLAEARSAVLQVPSAVVLGESNFILNPAHPDMRFVQASQFSGATESVPLSERRHFIEEYGRFLRNVRGLGHVMGLGHSVWQVSNSPVDAVRRLTVCQTVCTV